VPQHLLAANILDDGARLWFIDYEYSGNNDACFELGNIWSEASLPIDRLEHLVTATTDTPRGEAGPRSTAGADVRSTAGPCGPPSRTR